MKRKMKRECQKVVSERERKRSEHEKKRPRSPNEL